MITSDFPPYRLGIINRLIAPARFTRRIVYEARWQAPRQSRRNPLGLIYSAPEKTNVDAPGFLCILWKCCENNVPVAFLHLTSQLKPRSFLGSGFVIMVAPQGLDPRTRGTDCLRYPASPALDLVGRPDETAGDSSYVKAATGRLFGMPDVAY